MSFLSLEIHTEMRLYYAVFVSVIHELSEYILFILIKFLGYHREQCVSH